MKPPTLEEVEAYCREKGYDDANPEKFIAHYETIGWVSVVKGKVIPIKSWKGALRTWVFNGRLYAKRQAEAQTGTDRERARQIREQYLQEYTDNIIACVDWYDNPDQAPMGDPREAARSLWAKAQDNFGKPFCAELKARIKQARK